MLIGEVPLRIGDEAPAFRDLPGTGGKRYSLSSFDPDPVLAIVFLANGCPTVKGYAERLLSIQADYESQGVRLLGVNPNNPALSPADTLEGMQERSRVAGYTFPYLKDEDRLMARSYGALCTPHAFVLDRSRRLRYRGRIDDSRLPDTVTQQNLRWALDDVLSGRPVRVADAEPFGCSIVW